MTYTLMNGYTRWDRMLIRIRTGSVSAPFPFRFSRNQPLIKIGLLVEKTHPATSPWGAHSNTETTSNGSPSAGAAPPTDTPKRPTVPHCDEHLVGDVVGDVVLF